MSSVFLTIGAGALGLFAGALVNAKVLRSRKGLEFTNARACAVCSVPLKRHEMLPIVGYIIMKGRCRRCLTVIPWQYLATEIVIAILFSVFALRIALSFNLPAFVGTGELPILFARDALITLVLAVVFMFDYRASVIPDEVTIPGMILAIVFNLWLGMPVEVLLLGGLVIGGFFAVQYLVSGGRWVGGGDVRMGMLMGFLLGPLLSIVGLFISYVAGALVGIVLITTKRRDVDSHVPFGTFLAFATVICMLFGEQLLNWYVSFFA